jgi:hypothetical protein
MSAMLLCSLNRPDGAAVREVARALRLNSVLTSLVAEEWGEALGGDQEGLAALAGALALNRRLTRLSLAGSALQVGGLERITTHSPRITTAANCYMMVA